MYGFRPGRSCQDAIEAIYQIILKQPKYVLNVDIKGCFDNISHAAMSLYVHAILTVFAPATIQDEVPSMISVFC